MNLSKSVNFYYPLKSSESNRSSDEFRGNRSKFAEIRLIIEAKFGLDPLLNRLRQAQVLSDNHEILWEFLLATIFFVKNQNLELAG